MKKRLLKKNTSLNDMVEFLETFLGYLYLKYEIV